MVTKYSLRIVFHPLVEKLDDIPSNGIKFSLGYSFQDFFIFIKNNELYYKYLNKITLARILQINIMRQEASLE